MILVFIVFLLSVAISECPSNQVFMRFTKTSGEYANDESFYIWDGSSVVYSSPPFVSSVTVSFEHCFEPTINNQYRIQFVDARKDSWNPDSLLQIEGSYGNIVFKNYMTEMEEEFFPLSLYNPIPSHTIWKFSQSESTGWNTVLFNDAEWSSLAVNGVIPLPTSTQYYRVSFAGIASMAAYEVRFNYRYGIVAYVNGVEIYRDNMPSGEISQTTLAMGFYESYAFRGTLRSAVEVADDSVLAVEIHLYEGSSETIREFDAWLSMYAPTDSDKCFVVPHTVTVTTLNGLANSERIFDFNRGTSIYSGTYPVTVDYYFSGNVIPVVNGLRVYTQSFLSALRSFSFSGSMDGSDYSPFITVSNVAINTVQHTSWSTYSQQSAWRYYRGSFSSPGSILYLYEMQPAVCNVQPISTIVYPQSSYTYYVNNDYFEIRPSDSLITNCTTTSSLPSGLSLDSQTCILSGIPTSVFPNATITIHSSMNGGISGSFSLQIVNCQGKMVEILRTYKSDATLELFTIWDEMTKEVIMSVGPDNANPSNQDVATHLCLTTDRIGIEMGEESWSALSYLYVRLLLKGDRIETIARARRDPALNLPNYYIISLEYLVKPGDEWLYKHSEVPQNWYDASVTTGWNTSSYGLFPDSTNRIQLYKKTFNVDSLANITSFSINVQYCYGIIIVMNNREIFRYGVEGELTSESQATTSVYEVYYHMVTFPVKTYETEESPSVANIVEGMNTIAIAIVSVTTSQLSSIFDCTIRLIEKEEHSRVFEYNVLSSGISGTNTYPFDHYHGYVISNSGSMGNQLTIEFINRREWINMMVISNDLDSNDYNVNSFTFSAKNPEDEDYIPLKVVSGLEWSFAGQNKQIWILNNKPYNRYRWNTIKSSGTNGWRITMLDLRIESMDFDVPALSYTSPLTIFQNIEMAEVYPNSEFYTAFNVTPALPTGITIDSTTGMISGTTGEVGSGDYIISATKVTGGAVSFTLHLIVSYCTGGRSLITMTVRTDFSPSEGSYALYSGRDTSGTVVSSVDRFSQSSSLVYYDFCLPDNLYTMQLRDSWGDGWYNPAGMMLSVDVGEFRFEVEQVDAGNKNVLFSSYLPFQSAFTDWKIQREEVSNDWLQIGYDDSDWEVTKAEEIGTATPITVYLRHHFSIPSIEDYPVLNVLVKFGGGLIAYMNGLKIARFNLPSDVTSSTEAPTEHDASRPVFFHVIMNMVNASSLDNVIAIELHRAVDTSSSVPVSFYATGVFGVSDCSILRDSMLNVISTPLSDGTTDNFFDLSPLATSRFELVNYPYIEWQIENLEGSRFNGYGLLTSNDASQWGFSWYGRLSDPDFITLQQIAGESTKSRLRSVYSVPAGLIGFSALRWQIDAVPSSGTPPPVTELMTLYCKASGTICYGDEVYPSVYEGQISPAACASGFTGYSYRECIDGVLGEIKTDQCHYKIPSNIQYQADHYVLVKDIPFTTDAPSYDNIILEWYLLEGEVLPNGLSLNKETGIISGTPVNVTEPTAFTIMGGNPSGVNNAIVTISVRLGECRADGVWPTTPIDSVATYDCGVQGSYFGTQTRACILGSKDGEWQEISGICISYLSLVIAIVVVVVILLVVVYLLVKVSRKRKAVGGVRGAKREKAKGKTTKV